MKLICDKERCTMCGACRAVCPKGCITDIREGGKWFMNIDEEVCIDCGLCRRTCPNATQPDFQGRDCLRVGWACDEAIRRNSASGGIASSLYRYALESGWFICGVELDADFKARYAVTNDQAKLAAFINSKYTFSDASPCYNDVYQVLRTGGKVLLIGLPCQAAGIRNFLKAKHCPTEGLLVVDLVCHGTPLPELLPEHIKSIEINNNFQAKKLFFRDPNYRTDKFAFTIYGESIFEADKFASEKPQYIKFVQDDDPYQIGYHGAFIYRDSCYRCMYTRHERIGDLTLFDTGGLGKVERFQGSKINTSFILVNSEKGELLLKQAQNTGLIHCEDRPVAEAYDFNGQLNRPSVGETSMERAALFKCMQDGMSFDEAGKIAFSSQIKKNHIRKALQVDRIKSFIKLFVPREMIDYMSIRKYKNKG